MKKYQVGKKISIRAVFQGFVESEGYLLQTTTEDAFYLQKDTLIESLINLKFEKLEREQEIFLVATVNSITKNKVELLFGKNEVNFTFIEFSREELDLIKEKPKPVIIAKIKIK